jgi:hypothetical protein
VTQESAGGPADSDSDESGLRGVSYLGIARTHILLDDLMPCESNVGARCLSVCKIPPTVLVCLFVCLFVFFVR